MNLQVGSPRRVSGSRLLGLRFSRENKHLALDNEIGIPGSRVLGLEIIRFRV